MKEDFLHHLWQFKLFNQRGLKTTEGEAIEIVKVGQRNTDAGPDFFNAKIKIGKTLWAGNVEVHLQSSDWKKHSHHTDDAYKNVILHVVYEDDGLLVSPDGNLMPTLALKGKFNQKLFENYSQLLASTTWIPCEEKIKEVDDFTLNAWRERLLVERLEKKTENILQSLRINGNNWEETFYHQLAKNFGFRLNALPFELLAKSLPLQHLAKHKDHLNQLEALLFGQAGLLEKKFKDNYPNELKKEYDFLKKKFLLVPLDGSQWKFLRLRPSNFPTIRIAQFAQLIHKSSHLFSKILETEKAEALQKLFEAEVSAYWRAHYVFDKPSPEKEKRLGADAQLTILINTIVPFLFAYGRQRDSETHMLRALQLLEQLPAEKNSIISKWNALGILSENAAETQSLLQLKNEYCEEKKCLLCSVGNKIINEG